MYIRFKRKKDFLTADEQYQVYLIFLKYEQWKNSCRAYDQNDVVNHVLRQIRSGYMKDSQMIHFLMVDEV